MAKQTTKIGVARKRCAGKKGSALKSCMRKQLKGGRKRRK
jgi:hypothetical protein